VRRADSGTVKNSPTSQVIVITGASAGVGRATALQFARSGVCLGLIARGRAGLEAARAEVEERGARAIVLPADVADAGALDAAAAQVEEAFGPIDVWVNCAMVSVFSPVREMTPEEFRRVTEVTYLGVVNGTLAVLSRMLARNSGVIIQVGSALAYRGIPSRPRIARRSTPSRDSAIRCAASCCTTRAACASRWCRCPPSIPRSSGG